MKFCISILNSGAGPALRRYRALVIFPLSRRARFFGPEFQTFEICAMYLRRAQPRSARPFGPKFLALEASAQPRSA